MSTKTLADAANGPDWVLWVIGIVFACITILLLSGKGAWLIAGYNTASKEEQAKYNVKRLNLVFGLGMAVITALIFFMAALEEVLPAEFARVFGAVTVLDVVLMLVLANTICRKK